MEGRAPFLAALLLIAAISACQSTPPLPTATPVQPTATPDETACQQAILAADLSKEVAIAAVAGCRFTPGGEIAARQVLVGGGTRDQLWAATWVYGSTTRDAAPLLPLLANADPSLRVMAGGVEASLGQRAGIDALLAALDDPQTLAGSEPPVAINQYAVLNLSRAVVAADTPSNASPGPSPADPVAAWRSWLTAHGAQLTFDQGTQHWSLP